MTLLDLHQRYRPTGDSAAADHAAGPVDPFADPFADPLVIDTVIEEERVGSSYPRCADGNGTLTHLFFSDDAYDVARAKAICAKCGLATGCLAAALERAEPYGVWGGQLLVEGVVVAVKRGRGRPPKNPRPIIVDEVPIPPHLVA